MHQLKSEEGTESQRERGNRSLLTKRVWRDSKEKLLPTVRWESRSSEENGYP